MPRQPIGDIQTDITLQLMFREGHNGLQSQRLLGSEIKISGNPDAVVAEIEVDVVGIRLSNAHLDFTFPLTGEGVFHGVGHQFSENQPAGNSCIDQHGQRFYVQLQQDSTADVLVTFHQ